MDTSSAVSVSSDNVHVVEAYVTGRTEIEREDVIQNSSDDPPSCEEHGNAEIS